MALMVSASAFAESVARERLTGEIMASGIAASGKTSDGLENANRSGSVFGGGVNYSYDKGADHYKIAISSGYYTYTDDKRDNRWSNSVAGSYGRDLTSDVRLTGLASYTSQLLTLESSSADQTQVRARLSYSPGPHRVRVTGGWRWRDYRDLPDKTGNGPVAAVDYRYRIDSGRYLSMAARYDKIDSDEDRRDYRRYIVSGEYRFRPGPKTSAAVGLQWRDWTYPHRPIGSDVRHDRSIAPTFRVRHDFGNGWSAQLEGIVIDRNSNANSYDETVKRAVLTVRKQFEM
ncbi:MAG: hypothetical protein LBV45_03965 [Xanthomonadaceae bacterium]|nr:hypothetical protein [Xanthomonadaceae bacterium]